MEDCLIPRRSNPESSARTHTDGSLCGLFHDKVRSDSLLHRKRRAVMPAEHRGPPLPVLRVPFFFLRLRGDPLVLPFATIPANQHDDRAKELIQRHGDPEAVNAHLTLNRQQMSAAQADDQAGENRPQRGSFDIA